MPPVTAGASEITLLPYPVVGFSFKVAALPRDLNRLFVIRLALNPDPLWLSSIATREPSAHFSNPFLFLCPDSPPRGSVSISECRLEYTK